MQSHFPWMPRCFQYGCTLGNPWYLTLNCLRISCPEGTFPIIQLQTCTYLSVYQYHRKQQQIWWSDVMQSGSLNWPDFWVLACISTASSPQSEWCEAALPGWTLSWSAVLTAPMLTEMSSGREGRSQKASTFTACPRHSTWSTCTKKKRQHVTEDS